ncbi:MAG: ribonuclease P protein component [Bacteroidales bacterium]|nr:ribonuclease P protein component [Bacteroidales bacterium]
MSLYGFPKAEHLCGKNNFQLLFKEGRAWYTASLKLLCLHRPADRMAMQTGVVVPKRLFRHAVDRNRVKRLLREAYRLRKPAFQAAVGRIPCAWQLLFIYTGRELPTFQQVQKGVNILLTNVQKKYLTEADKKNGADCTKV